MEHDAFREGSYAKGDAHDGGGDDADKDGALDLIGHEHGGNQKADQGHDGGVVASHGGKVRHIGRGAHHDARIQKADECDKQADTGADGMLDGGGDGIDDLAPQGRNRHQEEQGAGDQHDGQGVLPGIAHAEAYAKGKEGVQAHNFFFRSCLPD